MTDGQSPAGHVLARGLGLWQATAINITQVVGAGVFLTIPLILEKLPGVYGLLAWLVAGVLVLADSMIWGELGAALPSAGGSYHFLLECYGRRTWGRLMAFLFVWQILISGPLEVATGLVAIAQFSTGLSADFKAFDQAHTAHLEVPISADQTLGVAFGPSRLIGFAFGVLILFLLYRRVAALGRISLVFLLGVLGVIVWVLLEGAFHFDPSLAFDTSFQAEERPTHFGAALGAGMVLSVYAYLGYYNICYLGGEVRDPGRTIPRSILLSTLSVVVLFTLVHLAMTGAMSWRDVIAAKENATAEFMSRVHGPWGAVAVTVCLIGSSFASAFAGAMGYSRVPFAAARERHFFGMFGMVHPRHAIPHRSLLLIGVLILFWSFFSLDAIISALIATRILEQFVAQVVGVMLLRHTQPDRPRPWKMWLYPLPCGIALVGWLFVYAGTGRLYIAIGAGTLVAGLIVFLVWAHRRHTWPFAPAVAED
jgi:basic amino acid/polyamine antiporter, APA family